MPTSPLAEVFGFPTDNRSAEAMRYRKNRLCPYNNRVPSCTKDKAKDPLGVCSIYGDDIAVITCPVRFRQDWLIAEDASQFFFSEQTHWTSLAEVRLDNKGGDTAGNLDIVLVSYDESGHITDFGALEVQAVYISGNVRQLFERYIANSQAYAETEWLNRDYPRPDYLSSSRKRLAPQLLYKGGILNAWNKKQAVALQTAFYDTFPPLPEVKPIEADMAWLLYDMKLDAEQNRYRLVRNRTVYTRFETALDRLTKTESGSLESFIERLQKKLDEKLDNGHPPDAPILTDLSGK